MEDEDGLLEKGEVLDDDMFRGDGPASTLIPWTSALLGSSLRILSGNVLGEDRLVGWDELGRLGLDRRQPVVQEVLRVHGSGRAALRGRYPVGPATFIGPCDIWANSAAIPRASWTSLIEPERAMQALWRATYVVDDVTTETYGACLCSAAAASMPSTSSGQPGPIIKMQEDASGLYSTGAVSPVPPAAGPLSGEPVRVQPHAPAFHRHVHPRRVPGGR